MLNIGLCSLKIVSRLCHLNNLIYNHIYIYIYLLWLRYLYSRSFMENSVGNMLLLFLSVNLWELKVIFSTYRIVNSYYYIIEDYG